MSAVYVAGDLHLHHKNIHKFRTQFATAEEHDEFVLDRYRSTITKRDTIIFTGDVAFSKEALEIVKGLAGNKICIVGNHDLERGIHMKHLVDTYSAVYGIWNKKGCWFTHAPIHPDELRGRFNIHGHVHGATLDDPRYYNTSLENIDFTPKKLVDIVDELKQRQGT